MGFVVAPEPPGRGGGGSIERYRRITYKWPFPWSFEPSGVWGGCDGRLGEGEARGRDLSKMESSRAGGRAPARVK